MEVCISKHVSLEFNQQTNAKWFMGGWLVSWCFLGIPLQIPIKKVSKSQNNWYLAQCLGLLGGPKFPIRTTRTATSSTDRSIAVVQLDRNAQPVPFQAIPWIRVGMRAHDPFRWGMMEGKHWLAIKLVIYLGKLYRPHCDLTGIMVNKRNHPNMALFQVSELL